ncbi:MAG: hypothetical protein FXF49_09300 [Flexistipes sinusarabici]|uniref:DUF3575 domain-containing protein n=1 Tax=Flexistipes sinusarabici TaxID=2352 RepID=A0A5D0MNL9_FLESI|nr:hypothetical protein [Flexistipes sinusarabici]TYB32848.1 MAG: hypothetical protein FXF49_09300 [Flexistipes sinusarabici]
MKKLISFVIFAICLSTFTGAIAETKPVQLSLTPDIAVHDKDAYIKGLTLNIWGENPQSALALGFVNGATGDSKGFSLGIFLNYAENYKGVQWSLVNYTKSDFVGWQTGIINYNKGLTKGLQSGVANYSDSFTGLQLGVVNYAATMKKGVQIGVINIIRENEWFTNLPNEFAKGMTIVNWRF